MHERGQVAEQLQLQLGVKYDWVQVQEGGSCAATSAEDGRWRAVDCALQLPTACRYLPAAQYAGSV